MNLDKLMDYDFAKDYVNGTLTEDKFLAELIKRVKTDQSFRGDTGIISLEAAELKKVVDALKAKRFHKSRRSFLKKAAIALGILAADSIGVSLASRTVDQRKLYEEISKIPYLRSDEKPIFSKNPKSHTIIIIPDIHGGDDKETGWRVEYARLELLRKKFEFNFVGVEGWAGHEADKKRGFRFLNAERMLIENLLKDKNYFVVGLEDPLLQILTYKHAAVVNHFEYLAYKEYIKGYKTINPPLWMDPRYHYSKWKHLSEDIYKAILNGFMKGNLKARDRMLERLKIKPTEENIQMVFKEVKAYFEREKLGDVSNPNTQDIIIDDKREVAAAKIMLHSMIKYGRNVAVIVFGISHIKGLAAAFRKISDVGIIFAGNPTMGSLFK